MNKWNMNFLPEGYEPPSSGDGYIKFAIGETRIRILSEAIIGWQDWLDKKPIRYRRDERPERSIDPKRKIQHFWSFIVWDYASKLIQIATITQSGIRDRIQELVSDKEWGVPFGYDIKVIRKGQSLQDTEYTVNPSPHSEITQEIKDAFLAKPIRLDALFDGEDPFDCSKATRTKGFFEEGQVSKNGYMTSEQVKKLEEMIGGDVEVTKRLLRYFAVESFYHIPAEKFQDIQEILRKFQQKNGV